MPHHPPLPRAPQPTREIFDPFNSSSTGHQTAPSRLSGSTSWRQSRSHKLAHQFRDRSGRGGSQHLSDLVGAGSVNWRKDGRKDNGDWEKGAPGLREPGWQDIRGLLSGNRKRTNEEIDEKEVAKKKRQAVDNNQSDGVDIACVANPSDMLSPSQKSSKAADPARESISPTPKQAPQIFRGLTIYLNGSTAPEVSDYKLKQLFAQHGGGSSLALGRRTVTHVIIGKTCGGGLASGKMHKEVNTVGGKGIKYVTAQWVLDSVDKGVRQPEGQYIPCKISTRIGGSRQSSVSSMFTIRTVADQGG